MQRTRKQALHHELCGKLADLLHEYSGKFAAVVDDRQAVVISLHQAFAASALTVQAKGAEDVTIDEHMRNQFAAAREAFKRLAETNADIWHEPPKIDRGVR